MDEFGHDGVIGAAFNGVEDGVGCDIELSERIGLLEIYRTVLRAYDLTTLADGIQPRTDDQVSELDRRRFAKLSTYTKIVYGFSVHVRPDRPWAPLSAVLGSMGLRMVRQPGGPRVIAGCAQMDRDAAAYLARMRAGDWRQADRGVDLDHLLDGLDGSPSTEEDDENLDDPRSPQFDRINAIRSGVSKASSGAREAGRAAARAAPIQAGRYASPERSEGSSKTIQELARLSTDPDALASKLNAMISEIEEVVPGLANTIGGVGIRAIQFLQSKVPKIHRQPFSGQEGIPDPIQQRKFERYLEAITAPMKALEKLQRGTFTLDHAEAMKAVYPRWFGDLQQTFAMEMLQADEQRKKVPFSTRIQMGIILEVPSDPSLQPNMLSKIQAAHGTQDPNQPGPGQEAPMAPS